MNLYHGQTLKILIKYKSKVTNLSLIYSNRVMLVSFGDQNRFRYGSSDFNLNTGSEIIFYCLLDQRIDAEIAPSVEKPFFLLRSSTDNKTQALPAIKRNAKILKLEVENVIGYTDSTSDMDSSNEISKVGLEDDLLNGFHIVNPNTHDDHYLKDTIETVGIVESVGCDDSSCLIQSPSTLLVTDTQKHYKLSPFVATYSETTTHEMISDSSSYTELFQEDIELFRIRLLAELGLLIVIKNARIGVDYG